jgi:site-specific recombinase XerD
MADKEQKKRKNPRGLFENPTGTWWIRYVDAAGKFRREKVGPKGAAMTLVEKRRTDRRLHLKLPEQFRAKPVTFKDLTDEAAKQRGSREKDCRIKKAVEKFGDRPAESITQGEITEWLDSHERWSEATKNRYTALFKLAYRLAEENGKITRNPARLLHMRKENNARTRYLNQWEPLPTKLDYLKPYTDEESRLRAVIEKKYPFHLPEFEIALNTGMRLSEQYSMEWPNVNFERRLLTVPRSKHGEKRHVPLNSIALAEFKKLLPSMARSNFVFLDMDGHNVLKANRHWFNDATDEAGVREFRWHDLRHTFASRLVMDGVDLRTVQELMGHKGIQMTCRYAHLDPAHQLAAVERLVPKDQREQPKKKRPRKQGVKTAFGRVIQLK